MQIFRHTDTVPEAARGSVLCLGNFDGFHKGHQAVFMAAHRIAAENGAPLAALTTEPHPRQFFSAGASPFRLSSLHTTVDLFEQFGLDILVLLRFDAALAGTQATDFVRNILVKQLGVAHIVVGYDYRFGQGRAGDDSLLLEEGRRAGFGLTVVPPVGEGTGRKEVTYSSTAIRKFLSVGQVVEAAGMLGHWWAVEGKVRHGSKLGRTLGYPTANVAMDNYMHPAYAVYAVRVRVDGDDTVHDAVANFGTRPTVEGDGRPLLEVFFLDGTHDLYDKHVTVEFVAFIRKEAKFGSLEVMQVQIAKDCDRARDILKDPEYARARFALVQRP